MRGVRLSENSTSRCCRDGENSTSRSCRDAENCTWSHPTLVQKVLQSDEGMLAQMELLVCLAAFLMIFGVIIGAYRRRSNNEKFRLVLWAAYTTPPSLINYATGLVNATTPRDLFPIWVVFLAILAVRADSFSAYSLDEHGQWRQYNRELMLMLATALLLLAISYADDSPYMIAVELIYLAVIIKAFALTQASMLAAAVLQKNAKLVVDYTVKEHLDLDDNQHEVDLTTMKGYTYLVRGEEEIEGERAHCTLVQTLFIRPCFGRMKVVKAEAPDYAVPIIKERPDIITVEKVWQCQGKLLKEKDPDHRIKDFCLSFALFKILSSRIASYAMPQEVNQKSWELFQKILVEKDGYERVSRIIEVELTFVFYQFYTKYQFIFQPHQWILKIGELVLVSVGSCLIAVNILDSLDLASKKTLPPIIVTILVIIVVPIFEILQLLLMIFSEWGKVVLICNYVKRESWLKNKYAEKLIEFICHTELLKPWERKLRQYSLLESYGYSPPWLLYNNLTATVIKQQKKGRKERTPVELSTEVKEAVISSLLTRATKLENGKNSLMERQMRKYLWACDLETQAQVIMVWHIATSMCEYQKPASPESVDTLKKFKIAINLSRYLAYLVAFAPRLLPDHPYVTEHVFDQVIIEACETFEKCASLENKIEELMNKCSEDRRKTVINRGARLGKQLLDDWEPTTMWNVLADLWVELLLYVAPSDDVDAHLEKLTIGGEFITQIWALLWHSGIERDPLFKTPKLERSRSCPKA